jgi:hypothetical protein
MYQRAVRVRSRWAGAGAPRHVGVRLSRLHDWKPHRFRLRRRGRKGIGGFDLATAYESLKKHATQPGNADAGYGRRGIEDYLQYKYCPADRIKQSAAETVDAAYGDFCIAQVAKALGHDADYQMFMQRSENWRHLFDPQTGFRRGKKADGSWLEPFDPVTWGDPYVEGSAWQHRWDVPHNFPALMDGLGGKEKTVTALEQMLTMPPDFNVGVYGQEIHEMSEMVAVPFGQYAQSNQPVHQYLLPNKCFNCRALSTFRGAVRSNRILTYLCGHDEGLGIMHYEGLDLSTSKRLSFWVLGHQASIVLDEQR